MGDLRKALRKRNTRFIGYYGITLFVPIMQGGNANRYVRAHGVRPIKGTGDVITMENYERLQNVVRKYVVPYNKLLLNHLKRMEKEKRSK